MNRNTEAQLSSESASPDMSSDNEGEFEPSQQDKEILEYARSTGKLPCVLWHPHNPEPTFCEKDLATGRYTVLGEEEELTATNLIEQYGPQGGWQSRVPNAIHIVRYLDEHKAVPLPTHPDDHTSHGEWYDEIWKNGEMREIEMLHKRRAVEGDPGSEVSVTSHSRYYQ